LRHSTQLVGEISRLRAALNLAQSSLARLSGRVIVARANSDGIGRARRLSGKTRASLVLQGRYMGYMRQLKPGQKAQVRKIKEAKGVRAAIASARALANA